MQTSTRTPTPRITLADIEAFDPHAARGGVERHCRCPICQSDERAFHFNTETGAFNCKRASCGARGKLADFWQERPKQSRAARAEGALHAAFGLRDNAPRTPLEVKPDEANARQWRQQLRGLIPMRDTPGAEYLQHRNIALETAQTSGARFAANFYGRAAVVFPIRDRAGALVAASGRYIDGRDNPKTRIAGHKRDGVFMAPVSRQNGERTLQPLEKAAPAIIITEAPIDALSIASAGFPAIALCGTTGPDWLHLACGFRRVVIAFDADDAGDNAAQQLTAHLATYGARCDRLRPEGAKDWNALHCASGIEALAEQITARVLADETLNVPDDDSVFDD
jgi:5S rRNA maturation endonuclease (ribonuclease M5)